MFQFISFNLESGIWRIWEEPNLYISPYLCSRCPKQTLSPVEMQCPCSPQRSNTRSHVGVLTWHRVPNHPGLQWQLNFRFLAFLKINNREEVWQIFKIYRNKQCTDITPGPTKLFVQLALFWHPAEFPSSILHSSTRVSHVLPWKKLQKISELWYNQYYEPERIPRIPFSL